MKLLLDSDVLIWFIRDTLGEVTTKRIESAEEVVVSAASVWELGIKHAKKRIELPPRFFSALADHGFRQLSVELNHAVAAAELPALHGDPFDRMLVAQARVEGLVLATSDRALDDYDVGTLQVARPRA